MMFQVASDGSGIGASGATKLDGLAALFYVDYFD